jgi:threonine dehydratase
MRSSQKKNVGILICGGNNDITRMSEIKERALVYSNLKALLYC